jgi:hypothetical protein
LRAFCFPDTYMDQPVEKPKNTLEIPDGLLIIGLIAAFVGLGLTVSWTWALVITGHELAALAIWLVEPRRPKKESA